MIIILKRFLLPLVLLCTSSFYAQVGIGTTNPHVSSILDISSSSKGFLMPRLTTLERNGITFPATGLMIYNTTLNDGQLNIGTPLAPKWIGIKKDETMLFSVTEGTITSTLSANNLLVPDMTISPPAGSYVVLFNAQMTKNQPFSSAQGVLDLDLIYQDLMAMSATNTHGVGFGSGEILFPGVYDVAGATAISGLLTLDGGGNPNSVFIIRCTGAVSTAASTSIILINGASANNIFWVSAAALSTGADTILKGSLVSNTGAISFGANTSIEGRMFTKTGAISIAAGCVVSPPIGVSPINLRGLSSFVMFSSNGAVSNVGTSTITGDVGTALGALTIIGSHFGDQYPAGTMLSFRHTTTYSIYQNGIEVINSIRTVNSLDTMVSLQAMVTTLTPSEAIEVRWKVDLGEATLLNRTLSLIRSGL